MHMNEIRGLAREYGLKTSRLGKAEIIRLIQKTEGNFDCFATPLDGYCDQQACLWRGDCLKAARTPGN